MPFLKEKATDSILEYLDEAIPEDSHILHLWQPLKFKVDNNFNFINHGIIFKVLSNLLYIIAFPILLIINKILLNFKIEGIENLQGIDTGKITVSNHVHCLDCTMMGLANFPNKTYFTSLESNFKIPIVKELITLLNALPIPTNKKYMPDFMNAIDVLLKNNNSIHFYPEASLWPYYTGLRNFKNGAFHIAVKNNVPIIPCVFAFTPVTGIRKYIRHKPFIKMFILSPVYPDTSLPFKEAQDTLKIQVYNKMKNKLIEVYGN